MIINIFKKLPDSTKKSLINNYLKSLSEAEKKEHVEQFMDVLTDHFFSHISQVRINELLDKLDENTIDFIKAKLKSK